MGILNIGVELLLHEHKHKKIAGNLLSIGKQLNTLSYNDLKPILDKYQIDKINFKNAYKYKLAKDSTRTIPETMYFMVVVEKKKKSTINKIPMQMQFLQKDDEDWRKKYNEYLKSSRPVMQFSKKRKHKIPYDTNHFKYLGSIT